MHYAHGGISNGPRQPVFDVVVLEVQHQPSIHLVVSYA